VYSFCTTPSLSLAIHYKITVVFYRRRSKIVFLASDDYYLHGTSN
jgi:hypothetical protein